MELKKAQGLFRRKVYIGHAFAEKNRDDFPNGDEGEAKYDVYLRGEEKKEYIELREPTNEEMRDVQIYDESYYKDAPESIKAKRFEEYQEKKQGMDRRIEAVVLGCVTGSSLTDDGKPLDLEPLKQFIKDNVTVYGAVMQGWMKIAQGFQREIARK